MLNDQNKKMCWEVLAKFGCEHQMGMVVEECAELQKAVCKIIRDDGRVADAHDENFREELVDVIVVCQQMFLALKMTDDEINKRAGAKLERALK